MDAHEVLRKGGAMPCQILLKLHFQYQLQHVTTFFGALRAEVLSTSIKIVPAVFDAVQEVNETRL